MSKVLTSKQYTYLFEHISVPDRMLQQWLLVPEFVDEVSDLFSNGETVNDESILQIMESIYSEYDPDMIARGFHVNGANFFDMGNAIRRLYNAIKKKAKR